MWLLQHGHPSCGQIILKLSFLGLVFKQCPLILYIVPRSRPNNEVGSKGLGLWIAYIRMASRLAAAVVAVLSLLPKLRESLLLREVHKGPLLGSLGKFIFKWLVLAFSFCKQTPFKMQRSCGDGQRTSRSSRLLLGQSRGGKPQLREKQANQNWKAKIQALIVQHVL